MTPTDNPKHGCPTLPKFIGPRAIAEKGRIIRLPIHITERLNKIKKAQRQLSQQLGRTPTLNEMTMELNLTQEQVLLCLERSRLPISLDLLVGEERNTELGELLEDTGISPEDYVIHSTLATEMERLLAELTPQQQEVLILHFGLLDGKSLTKKLGLKPRPCRAAFGYLRYDKWLKMPVKQCWY